ncbi:hypothetical protein RJP21_10330 [Paenibacillus sp. VCA1]|uniref:hypothetical protein n=1 Tax=Paenibacillus sp. VCA1 TaxID=3039148 RepID=UPI0028720605|nr:hypothetical protein [Paenibacillus sp. VCA1]MDR9853997.1 hypothetical protein [Paenibacillus sp. VCA1]
MSKRLGVCIALVLFVLLLPACSAKGGTETPVAMTGASNSWAFDFVRWNDKLYRLTDEDITPIDREIGAVESFIDDENIVGHGVYSNTFAEGTKLYSIPNVRTEDAIAVEANGGYLKMINTAKDRTEQR